MRPEINKNRANMLQVYKTDGEATKIQKSVSEGADDIMASDSVKKGDGTADDSVETKFDKEKDKTELDELELTKGMTEEEKKKWKAGIDKDVANAAKKIEKAEDPYSIVKDTRGKIGQQIYESFEKGGEGSKGGKVIGHTKSGKAIYGTTSLVHKHYDGYDSNDHKEVSNLHKIMAHKHLSAAQGKEGKQYIEHSNAVSSHMKAARHHEGVSGRLAKQEAKSLATPAPEGMTHLKHSDEVPHGGFSAKVWNSPNIQTYSGGYGAIYHENRTPETDKHLESLLGAHGMHADEAAHFLTSRQARHTMDAYSEGYERVEKDLPSNIAWYKKEQGKV